MNAPDWRNFAFDQGILPEPITDGNRLVLWLRGDRDATFQYWDRVGNVARAEITLADGLCATPATSIRARQRIRGGVGQLLRRLREPKGNRDFLLPDGGSSEQCGERRTDLLLVWTEDKEAALDLDRIKSRWPHGTGFWKLGSNFYLVSGIESQRARRGDADAPPPFAGTPREAAAHLLDAARKAGDRRKEATALADLGVTLLSEGDPRGAIASLETSLALARELGDEARGSDVIGNLGMAMLAVGQPGRAREMFEHELGYARATGNRFAEKVALERLGLASSNQRDFTRALSLFEEALALARELDDRQHQANLLWYQGIQYAEMGQRERAIAKAEESITLLKSLEKPQAAWYGALLQKYRMGLFEELPGAMSPGVSQSYSDQAYLGGSIVASIMTGQPSEVQSPGKVAGGPGLLRMALSATKAMAGFLGSGMKTTTPETQRKRLQTCAVCEHHTGLRCKICGCFTNVKSRMLHEKCPIGKW
jgi:hypothetical protein